MKEFIKRIAISIIAVVSLFNYGRLFSQDVYLRLTDYGGGKINLALEPFSISGVSEGLVTKIHNIEIIIREDLQYSLYFEIFPDTTFFLNSDNQGIVLKGNGDNSRLSIILADFQSHETIAQNDYEIGEDIRKTAHKISDDVVEILVGEKGIASTKIVFSYKTSTGKELAMIDYDGFTFTPLTKNRNFNLFPAWAPDGKRVIFSTYARGRLNLYLFDLVGRVIESLSSFRGLNFASCWSPDGTKICLSLTKDGNAEIYLLDLKTKKLNRLTNNRAIDVSPAFSPSLFPS